MGNKMDICYKFKNRTTIATDSSIHKNLAKEHNDNNSGKEMSPEYSLQCYLGD